MKRRDWLILAIVLTASLALFLLRPQADNSATEKAYLRITVPGQSYDLIPLDQEKEIEIRQDDGSYNVVEIFPGGFRMKESNCTNQNCIQQGDVTLSNMGSRALANEVICLPHRVVLELVTGDDATVTVTP
jgi:hypothetical protein